MDTCKYVHYEIDYRDTNKNDKKRDRVLREEGSRELTPKLTDELDLKMLPPQVTAAIAVFRTWTET